MSSQFIIGVASIFFGGGIYMLFRTESLLMFKWFSYLSIIEFLQTARNATLQLKSNIPSWIIYSLPDGLYLFSYVSIMLFIWNNELHKKNSFWIFLIPIIAITSELGQIIKIIPGTFDFIDILMFLLGTIIPIQLFTKHKLIYRYES